MTVISKDTYLGEWRKALRNAYILGWWKATHGIGYFAPKPTDSQFGFPSAEQNKAYRLGLEHGAEAIAIATAKAAELYPNDFGPTPPTPPESGQSGAHSTEEVNHAREPLKPGVATGDVLDSEGAAAVRQVGGRPDLEAP